MTSENGIGDRLKAARLRAGYASAASAGRAFGWSEVTYRAHENGLRGIKPAVAALYADAFRVRLAWLLTGERGSPAQHRIDIVGEIGADGTVQRRLRAGPPRPVFAVETDVPMPPQAVGFRVVGADLQPRYDPGDIIVCSRSGEPPQSLVGREAVVVTQQGRGYLRVVRSVTRGGLVELGGDGLRMHRGLRLAWGAPVISVVRVRKL